ncbi:hypothetical protein V8F33_008013 [Rhypophila sp. PSN 637]
MPLTTVTLSGPLVTHANGSVSPGLPTNNVEKKDLPIPQGYDNDFNYQAPAFHLAIILGCLVPLGLYLLAYLTTAVRLIRWNKKTRERIATGSGDEPKNPSTSRVPVPEPLPVSDSGLELAPPIRTDTDLTSSPAIAGEEQEEGAEATGPADHEEIPEASLVGGDFEPTETFRRLSPHIPGLIDDIPRYHCPVYAVCGWMAAPNPYHFIGLHFSRGPRNPGEHWYSASAHLMLRAVEIDEDLRVPDSAYDGTIFSQRFRDDTSNPSSTEESVHESSVQYTLEPDSANSSISSHSFQGPSRREFITLPEGSAVKFKLMFWGPRRGTEEIHPASNNGEPRDEADRTHPADGFGESSDEDLVDEISYYPIELGTIMIDRHWAFFYKKAPRPGEPFFDYNKLMRNLQSGEKPPMLGVGLRWGDYGDATIHTSPLSMPH